MFVLLVVRRREKDAWRETVVVAVAVDTSDAVGDGMDTGIGRCGGCGSWRSSTDIV